MRLCLIFSGALLLLAAGCQSHREPTAVSYEPGAAPLTPTSDRPSPRVYAPVDSPDLGSAPLPRVKNSDVILAQNISALLKGNTHLADVSANVLATVENGTVTLRGTVPAFHDREEIVKRISNVPGVHQVNDHLGVEGER